MNSSQRHPFRDAPAKTSATETTETMKTQGDSDSAPENGILRGGVSRNSFSGFYSGPACACLPQTDAR